MLGKYHGRHLVTLTLFILVSLTWGTTWLAMKMAVATIPPIFATGLRFLLASPVLIIIAKLSKKPLLFPEGKRGFQVALTVFYFAIPFTLMIYGEQSVSSGMASILFSTMPAAIVISSYFFLKQRITLLQSTGVVIATLALGFIIYNESGTVEIESWRGVLAILIAVAMHAIIYVKCKRQCSEVSILTYNALPCLGASLLLISCAVFSERIDFHVINVDSFLSVAYLGIVSGVLGIMAYFQLQQRATPFYASLVYFIFPLIAVSLEDIVRKHRISTSSLWMIMPLLLGIFFVLFPLWRSSLKKSQLSTSND